MIKKYHVHIYKVISMGEVDTLAYSSIKAREMALEAAKRNLIKLSKPGCSFVAIEFEQEKKEG